MTVAGALPGCAAAVAVPAIGSAAASGGASALVRAGSTAVQDGTAYRTFDAPLTSVHDAVETTLARLEFPTPDEQPGPSHEGAHREGGIPCIRPGEPWPTWLVETGVRIRVVRPPE